MSDPLSTWKRMSTGNENGVLPVGVRNGASVADRPLAAVFRCADAGLPSELVFGQRWGSLVDVSTWGHVIDIGVIATLEYAVESLEVPLIVVLGHDDCGATRAAMRARTEAALPDGSTRIAVEHVIGSMVRRGSDRRSDRRSDKASIEAVTAAHVAETGLALLERSRVIARRVDAGRCAIVCATADARGWIRAWATVGAVGEDADSLLECV